MDSTPCPRDAVYVPPTVDTALKILIVGHFGVGKTTLVSSLSEITPLSTEEVMTEAGEHIDDLTGADGKTTTTVAMDFGRLTISSRIVLYLFGVPGQERFTPMWPYLARGALGALVLADTRRLEASFAVMDRLECAGLRYVVAVNQFDGAAHVPLDEVREALDLLPATPLLRCDARDPVLARKPLIALVTHLPDTTEDQETA